LADAELMLVDDIDTLTNLVKIFGHYNSVNQKLLDEFDFLANWPKLALEAKLQKYEKFAGHELHLFLYFKDKIFFENVAKEHLKSKKEKQFIDHFLLGDYEGLIETELFNGLLISREIHEIFLGLLAIGEKVKAIGHNDRRSQILVQKCKYLKEAVFEKERCKVGDPEK
jgi:hypothetical protein